MRLNPRCSMRLNHSAILEDMTLKTANENLSAQFSIVK